MRRIVLGLLPLLAGCATGPNFETRMTSYTGAPEAQLVQTLGVPDKQITVNGVAYLAYVRSQAQVQPNLDFGFGGWGGPFWGANSFVLLNTPQNIQVWSCETTFAVRDGKVWNVTFKGNDCS